MKIVKDKNNNIISGTEVAYQKPTKKEVKDFTTKWKDHKIKYIKDHTVEEMVYENGSALALLYKEVVRLNQLLTTNLKTDEKEKSNN